MIWILLLHVLVALVAPALVRRWGRSVFAVLALAPATAAVWALAQTGRVLDGDPLVERYRWVSGLDLEITFRIDTLSWFMLLIVGGVGALVLFYCARYFSQGAKANGRFAGVFVAFAGAMLGLVTTDSTLMMYVFWELTTVFSYLLIGHYSERKVSRRAAMQAIIVTTFGGLAMLGGIVVMGEAPGGSYSLHELTTHPPALSGLTATGIVLMLVGALSKSAIVPFHFWLPAAMAAPTPVSAYLHAAAMVKAGVYLVARLAPGFATWDAWQWTLMVLACYTMLLGGYRALRQWDLKLVLAYGTVSQLGLLLMLVGQSDRAVALAGIAMVGGHAMFKATLFLVTGIVDAATGTRDIHQLSGLRRSMPFLSVVAALATASMIGLPPTAGYVAKEAALEGLVHAPGPWPRVVLVVMVLGSILTVAYGLRFWWGAFSVKKGLEDTEVDREAWPMFLPPTVLAVAGVVFGCLPGLGQRLLSPYADTYPAGEHGHLTLWGGLTLPLLLTVVILVAGVALFALGGRDTRLQSHDDFALDAETVYHRFMRNLDRASAYMTGFTQRGSIPYYLTVILVVSAVATGTAALWRTGEGPSFGSIRLWDSPAQLVVGVFVVVAAIAAARSRRRLKAVLLLGVSGYGVALLYELHAAPDLALTQVLVETVTLVVFVLVLRRLPAYFSNRPLADSRWLRAGLGVLIGGGIAFFAYLTTAARVAEPISTMFPEEAYAYGSGKNIVNVTLVDTRAWDTMGEISVLLVAATGVASLVFFRVRTARVERVSDAAADAGHIVRQWIVSSTEADRTYAALGAAEPRTLLEAGPLPSASELGEAVPVAPRPAARPGSVEATTGRMATGSRGTADAGGLAASVIASRLGQAASARRATQAVSTWMRNQRWISAATTIAPQRRSVILEIATRLLFHTMIVFSVFLLFVGHNRPGGGFAGGLVVGIALVLRYLAGGRYELGEAAPVNAGVLLGTGLFLSAGVGLFPLLLGHNVLQSFAISFDAGPFGHVKLVTSLFFDIGVYLVVVGLVLDVLRSFGSELDRQGERSGTHAPDLAFDADDADDDAVLAVDQHLTSSVGAEGASAGAGPTASAGGGPGGPGTAASEGGGR